MAVTVEQERTRNIGIIAHVDGGKTTTTERFLFYTGRTHKIGDVDDGTTTMDWMDQERERGITIQSAATSCFWKDHKITIIDTPGHVDFTAEVERSLRVLDGAIGIFCGVSGVQPQSETVWRQSEKYGIPRILYINKMDRTGADLDRVVAEIEKKLAANVLVMQVPIGKEGNFLGIIDLVEEQAVLYKPDALETEAEITDIPQEYLHQFINCRNNLLEKVAEVDDEIMVKYLEGIPVGKEELKEAIRKGTLSRDFFPAFCGSSQKNRGTMLLLDAVLDYLPSPIEREEIVGENPVTNEKASRVPSQDAPLSLLVFKVYNEMHLGKLYYGRVYSGRVRKGERIHNWTSDARERVGRIFQIHARKYEEVEEARAGDIIGMIGLKDSRTGDTLGCSDNPVVFERTVFPEPVLSVAVEPKMKTDQEKVFQGLHRLSEEDPTIKLRVDERTGQIIISGMGELHISVLTERLRREQNLDIAVGQPEVAYRETVTRAAETEVKFVKQTGGKGQYAHVVLSVEPLPRDGKFVFENAIREGRIPIQFIPAVEKGIKDALQSGNLAGYEVVDVKVTLLDGSFHAVDSSDIAFRTAGSMAFKQAYLKAKPVILEPIMRGEIVMPEEYIGEVLHDFSMRKGRVETMETRAGITTIRGLVPLRTTFGYTTALRSVTQGRGTAVIEPAFYEKLPEEIAREIIGN